jgi:hypothetical protein
MFEYHVMGAATIAGFQAEINKRVAEGWEFVTAYYDVKWWGPLLMIGRRHVAVFRREKQS